MANYEEQLTACAKALRAAGKDDAAEFSRLIEFANRLGVTNKEIGFRFGISKPTVARWLDGTTAPHPIMRKHVLDWFAGRCDELAEPIHKKERERLLEAMGPAEE